MSEHAKILFDQIMALPPDERYSLLDAVEEAEDACDADDLPPASYTAAEWDAELARRLKSVEDGTAELIPWEVARERIEQELERRRAARANGEQS